MSHFAPRLLSGVLIIASTTALVSASSSASVRIFAATSRTQPISAGRNMAHSARQARTEPSAAVSGPTGCTSTFNAPFAFTRDVSGGGSDHVGFALAIVGVNNASCDGYSSIDGGTQNTIGGDGLSERSIIAGGQNNGIESGASSFIGAGNQNLLGLTSPYRSSSYSAIVSGTNNTVASPASLIGAGERNVIAGLSVDGSGYGQSAFIGAGYNNAVSGSFASIVAGQSNSVAGSNSAVVSGYKNTISAVSPNVNGVGEDAFVGGGNGNSVSGNFSSVVGGLQNTLSGDFGTIAGGITNAASAQAATIAGGWSNSILSGAGSSNSIGGGYGNTIFATYPGNANTIAGGQENRITGQDDTIGGGDLNGVSGKQGTVSGGYYNFSTGEYATIGGGTGNNVSGSGSVVAGGFNNIVSAVQGTIAGGYNNSASGKDATIPGGSSNTASGPNSFAAGTKASAATLGAFVWADDSTTTALTSTVSNQFLARAAGGFYLYSSATLKSGVKLAPGSGSWSSLSDRAAKTGIENVSDTRILAKLAALPVSEWSYIAQGTGVRHLGPMAQDFHAAFGLGEDDKHISAVDEEGVALAAIKALQAEVTAKDREIADLDAKYKRLEQRVDALTAAR